MNNNNNMVYIIISLIFFLLSPATAAAGSGSSSLSLRRPPNTEDALSLTCRKATDFGFCVATLKPDPRSGSGASVDVLAHIALEKLEAHAKGTTAYLENLYKSCSEKEKVVTGSCIRHYGAAVNSDVPSAVKYMNEKDYESAKRAVLSAMDRGGKCQGVIDQFPSSKWQLQSSRNGYMHDVSQLSKDLIQMLLG